MDLKSIFQKQQVCEAEHYKTSYAVENIVNMCILHKCPIKPTILLFSFVFC